MNYVCLGVPRAKLMLSLAAADDSSLLGGHSADDLERLPLHLLGFELGLLSLLSQLLSLLSCQQFGLCLALGLEEKLLVSLVGLAERVDKPGRQVVVFLLLLPFDFLPLLLSLSLGDHARVENLDRHLHQLANSFLLSCFLGSDSSLLSLDLRLNFSLKDLFSLGNEFRKLDLDVGSHNKLVFVLPVVGVAVLVPFTLREEAFRHILSACVDLFDSELFHLLELLCSADAASEREGTAFLVVQGRRSRRVRDTQWAVMAVAVLGGRRCRIDPIDNVVAWCAEVIGAPAAVSCNRAAVHTLPVNELNTVFLALSHANSHLIKHALLAQKILFLSRTLLSCVHLLLAVNQTTEVGLLALEALVERATMHRVFERLIVVKVVLIF